MPRRRTRDAVAAGWLLEAEGLALDYQRTQAARLEELIGIVGPPPVALDRLSERMGVDVAEKAKAAPRASQAVLGPMCLCGRVQFCHEGAFSDVSTRRIFEARATPGGVSYGWYFRTGAARVDVGGYTIDLRTRGVADVGAFVEAEAGKLAVRAAAVSEVKPFVTGAGDHADLDAMVRRWTLHPIKRRKASYQLDELMDRLTYNAYAVDRVKRIFMNPILRQTWEP